MKIYENKIIETIGLKYRYSEFNSRFISIYIKKLKQNLKKYRNLNLKVKYKKKLNFTENFLYSNLNKKLSQGERKKIIILYKKFNANLKLKTSYDKKFKKTNNKNCHIRAYLFIANITENINEIPFLNNLNCLLKIQDIVSIKISKLNNFEKDLYVKLIFNIVNKLKKLNV